DFGETQMVDDREFGTASDHDRWNLEQQKAVRYLFQYRHRIGGTDEEEFFGAVKAQSPLSPPFNRTMWDRNFVVRRENPSGVVTLARTRETRNADNVTLSWDPIPYAYFYFVEATDPTGTQRIFIVGWQDEASAEGEQAERPDTSITTFVDDIARGFDHNRP